MFSYRLILNKFIVTQKTLTNKSGAVVSGLIYSNWKWYYNFLAIQ